MKTFYGNKNKIVDHVFWITFLLFTNPGGVLEALGLKNRTDVGVDITDVLFGIMLVCFILVYEKNKNYNDLSLKKIRNYLIIFLIYYVLVFSFIVPALRDNPLYSPLATLIKIRHVFINISFVVIVYEFYLRSYMIFYKYFLYTSIIIILLFIVSVFSSLDILPIREMERRFIETKRLLMESYGLLPILIPMGIVAMVFKFNIKYQKVMILGFSLMFFIWLLSIFRRHIFGTIIYIFISLFFYNYLYKKSFISIKKMINIIVYSAILIFIIQITFPKYIQSAVDASYEAFHVIQYGKTSSGKVDARLGGGKDFLQNIIHENYIFGTGFDIRWRTGEGNKAGYEASDYPFLGAIAMFGVFGLLFFLPVYIVLIKSMRFDIKYLRKHRFDHFSFEAFMVILFIVYFIFDLLQYMNWFLPLSVILDERWYVFLAMYLASRKLFYDKERSIMSKNPVH